jgi:hypothetical protein
MNILIRYTVLAFILVNLYLLLFKILGLFSNMWGPPSLGICILADSSIDILSFSFFIYCYRRSTRIFSLALFFPFLGLIIRYYNYISNSEVGVTHWFEPLLKFLCYFFPCSFLLIAQWAKSKSNNDMGHERDLTGTQDFPQK